MSWLCCPGTVWEPIRAMSTHAAYQVTLVQSHFSSLSHHELFHSQYMTDDWHMEADFHSKKVQAGNDSLTLPLKSSYPRQKSWSNPTKGASLKLNTSQWYTHLLSSPCIAHTPGDSYCGWLRSLLLCPLSYAVHLWRAIHSLSLSQYINALGLILFQIISQLAAVLCAMIHWGF